MSFNVDVINDLNETGENIVTAYLRLQTETDPIVRESIEFYLTKGLKFDLTEVASNLTEKEIRAKLKASNKYQITMKDVLNEAIAYIGRRIDMDRLNLVAKSNARTKKITLSHQIKINKSEYNDIFDLSCGTSPSVLEKSFVPKFLDVYVRKQINKHLATVCMEETVNYQVGNSYTANNGDAIIEIDFDFKLDDLTDELLYAIAETVINEPVYF